MEVGKGDVTTLDDEVAEEEERNKVNSIIPTTSVLIDSGSLNALVLMLAS